MHHYIKPLIQSLAFYADPVKAVPMKKYMKDKFEYLGIPSPQRKDIQKEFWKQYGLPEVKDLRAIVKDLWNMPQREFQYVAIDMLEKMVRKLDKGFLPLFEYMIITKSWWDTVDSISVSLTGEVLRNSPDLWNENAERWYATGNMWLQRTAILFQLKYKQQTDQDLLFSIMRRCAPSKEFFIRKAIGWRLRELSKFDEPAVVEFINSCEVSNLTRTEALKWVNSRK